MSRGLGERITNQRLPYPTALDHGAKCRSSPLPKGEHVVNAIAAGRRLTMRDLARSNGMGLSEAKKAGLIKPVENTGAGSVSLTPALGVDRPNSGEAPSAPVAGFKKRKVDENGNGVPGSAQPVSGYRAGKQ